jgi:hypothetical protein
MRRLTYAIVVAGAVLCADTSTAVISCDPTTTDCPPPPPPTTGSINCDGAALSPGVIWPPDHKMVPLTIVGVTTDPSLMQYGITITITGIYQDEPVNALGSGNTAPDGYAVNATTSTGTSTAYVRAERAGPGTGRIYYITFTATDASGVSCGPKTLQAYVPHDQGQGYAPIDTGVQYNSTVVPP